MMETISEDEEEAGSSIFCCCSKSGKNNAGSTSRSAPEGPSAAKVNRPPMQRSRQSVYLSAREVLGGKELEALKEFEDAAVATYADGDETMFFDALDALESSTTTGLDYAPAQFADPRPRESISMEQPGSLLKMMEELKDPKVNVHLAGYPGNLTEEELQACQRFRNELAKRRNDTAGGQTYTDVVRIYDPVEPEPYALCRFLRARQFDVDKVFEMITEVLDVWREAQTKDYFPDANAALGAPVNVFLTQMPTVSSGCAKNGAPVSYGRAESLSVEGMECLIELDDIENYAWYSQVHKFKAEIARAQSIAPDLVRAEALQVWDLKGLSASALNKRTLETMQKLAVVNKCFPEVLNGMVILNAPYFFSFFWKIIRAMLDPRTANKITMFSNEQEGLDWLKERIDESELLSDYGGKGESFDQALSKQNVGSSAKRQVVKRYDITYRTNDKVDFTLKENEKASFKAYTRSTSGADFELLKSDGKRVTVASVPPGTQSTGPEGAPKPFSVDIFTDIQGPGEFSIKSKGKAYSTDYFVVAGEVFEK